MKTTFVLLAAVVAFASAHRGNSSPEERVCKDILKPSEDRDTMRQNMDTCIAEQDGLQATIDGLKPVRDADGDSREGGPGGRRPGGGRGGRHGGKGGNPIRLLEENGYTDEATALKTCLARINGHLASDGSFDVSTFQSELRSRASGTEQQSNIEAGLEGCDATVLSNFEVYDYMKCVISYCATGAAPTE